MKKNHTVCPGLNTEKLTDSSTENISLSQPQLLEETYVAALFSPTDFKPASNPISSPAKYIWSQCSQCLFTHHQLPHTANHIQSLKTYLNLETIW